MHKGCALKVQIAHHHHYLTRGWMYKVQSSIRNNILIKDADDLTMVDTLWEILD